jgi:hypothetical protein
MTPKQEFRSLAVAHGMRDENFVELAGVKGYLSDIDTHEKRLDAVKRFKAANGHLFGSGADHAKTMVESFGHASALGMSDAQAKALEATIIDRHVAAYGVKAPKPEKPVRDMTVAEAAVYEQKLLAHHARAQAGRVARAELRATLPAFMNSDKHG